MPRPTVTAPNPATFLNADGTLRIVDWAKRGEYFPVEIVDCQPGQPDNHLGSFEELFISLQGRSVQMAHTVATGDPLVTNGLLGVDVIRIGAGQGFTPHTHPGDHLLIVVGGEGTITYDGRIYPTHAGQVYLIEGSVPHAVGAITDHVILAVGAPHRAVGSPDRATLVEYAEVAAQIGNLHCLICDQVATLPQRLHDLACPHCPCEDCNPL